MQMKLFTSNECEHHTSPRVRYLSTITNTLFDQRLYDRLDRMHTESVISPISLTAMIPSLSHSYNRTLKNIHTHRNGRSYLSPGEHYVRVLSLYLNYRHRQI